MALVQVGFSGGFYEHGKERWGPYEVIDYLSS